MTGTPHIGHGESNGATAGADRKSGRRFPWQLGVAVAAWMVLGVLLIVSALISGSTSDADQGSVDQIQSQLGSSAVSTGPSTGHPALWLLLGLVTLLLALLLLIRQGWARYALAVLGVIAVVVLASSGRWEAIVAFAMLVVGSVPLLAPSAHRYLTSS
jgi:hypothetical protein